jgi:hypothetical protein
MSGKSSSFGFGLSPKNDIAPGPPFGITAANNGLSVDPITGQIVLGNDNTFAFGGTAQLLNSREIFLNGSSINIYGPTGNVQVSDNQISVFNFAGPSLNIDCPSTGAEIILTTLAPDLSKIVFSNSIGAQEFRMVNDAGKFEVRDSTATKAFLSLNQITRSFQLGDINGVGNSLVFIVDDIARRAQIKNSIDNFLFIDLPTKNYQLGSTADGDIVLIDGSGSFLRNQLGGNNLFVLDQNTTAYSLGDIDGSANGTTLTVDDALTEFRFIGASGIRTTQPSANGNTPWKLGKVIAAASVLDGTKYVEVSIGGVIVKLATIV